MPTNARIPWFSSFAPFDEKEQSSKPCALKHLPLPAVSPGEHTQAVSLKLMQARRELTDLFYLETTMKTTFFLALMILSFLNDASCWRRRRRRSPPPAGILMPSKYNLLSSNSLEISLLASFPSINTS